MKTPPLKFKTIIMSDIHLGTGGCKIDEVNHFIKYTWSEKLILNGDIIDGWSLGRKGGWSKKHTYFVRRVLKIAEKKGTEVIYLAGNHDELLRSFLPIFFDQLKIMENYIHEAVTGRKYFCLHGDVFDTVTSHSKILAIIGDIGYQNLLRLNHLYAKWRKWRGKEYFSLSKFIKARIKSAVSHLSSFENHLQSIAKKENCTGVICGHIHTPEDKMMGNIHYLNSGDWVESMTAIVEHFDGELELLDYQEFCRRIGHDPRGKDVPVELDDIDLIYEAS